MKLWVLAVLIFLGLVSWGYLMLAPGPRRHRAAFNRRPGKPINLKDLDLTARGMSKDPIRHIPPPPKTAAEVFDMVDL